MMTQGSLFSSSLVHVYVGKDPKLFYVHRDILAQFPLFISRIEEEADGPSITDTRASVRAFDLVLHWLYGQPFDELKPYLAITNTPGTTDMDTLQPACELLCIAVQYALVELESALTSYFLDVDDVGYQSILTAAKYVYTKAPRVNHWFEKFIYDKTQEALTADPDVADETWFTKIFEHGNSGLSKRLFVCYKDWCKSSHAEILTPISEGDKFVDSEDHTCPEQPSSADADEDPDKLCQIEDEHIAEEMTVLPEEELPKELPVAWDHGLNGKERKRKEKRMKLDGMWDDRITQDMIDIAAAEIAAAELDPAPEAELEASAILEPAPWPTTAIELEPELETVEEMRPWDSDLSPKQKKANERQMKLEGTWETRLTQDMIDREIAAAAAAAKHIEIEVKPLVAPGLEPEPEPEPIVEEHDIWAFGDWGSSKSKAKKKKEISFSEPEPVPQLEEVVDDSWSWGPGSKTKNKSKKKSCSWLEPSLEEEVHPGPEPEPEPEPVLEPEPELPVREPWTCSWGFETKPNNQEENSFPPNPDKALYKEEVVDDAWDVPSHSSRAKKSKKIKKGARPVIEPILESEPELEPTTEEPRAASPVPELAEQPQEHSNGPCIDRSEHLLEATQWQACPTCLKEVAELARVMAGL